MKRVCALFLMLAMGWVGLFALVTAGEDDNALGALRDDAAAPSPAASASPAAGGGEQSYTIVSGDWLSKIAERFLGSADKWPQIYNANKDKLGPNPDLIFPGVQITIPKDDGTTGGGGGGGGGGTGPGGGTPNPGGNSGPFAQQRPVDHGTVTSNFGPRNVSVGSRYHEALDIGIPNGTPVKATGPGKVIFAGVQGGYGNLVKVAHADGTVTYFAHLMSNFKVRVGDQVGAGQQLAASNNSGTSTGPHLHFGVEKNGKFVDPRGDFKFPPVGGTF